jgi:hypothetical protein
VEEQLKGKYILEAFWKMPEGKRSRVGKRGSMKKSKHEVGGSFHTGKISNSI